jgi:hypothetical protein
MTTLAELPQRLQLLLTDTANLLAKKQASFAGNAN